jgi:ribonuclease P protein subunit POP4
VKVAPTIIQHEFVGLEAAVTESSNPDCRNISGIVVDETRNTFVILRGGKRKTVVKNQVVLRFRLPDESIVQIDGKVLVGRPEERLKRRIRRLW